MAASLASNDHEPVHHDHEIARAQGLDDIIASIVTTAGLVLRYTGLTAGDAPCRSLSLRLARPAFPGDVLTFRAKSRSRQRAADSTCAGIMPGGGTSPPTWATGAGRERPPHPRVISRKEEK